MHLRSEAPDVPAGPGLAEDPFTAERSGAVPPHLQTEVETKERKSFFPSVLRGYKSQGVPDSEKDIFVVCVTHKTSKSFH